MTDIAEKKSKLTPEEIKVLREIGRYAGQIMLCDTGNQRRVIFDAIPNAMKEHVRVMVEEHDYDAIQMNAGVILSLATRQERGKYLSRVSDYLQGAVEAEVRKRFKEGRK